MKAENDCSPHNRRGALWTRDKISQLIELYRTRECLWNLRHECYKNKKQRKRAIEEICSTLSITTFEFGKKIHNLRNQFNSEMKKLHQRLETAGGILSEAKPALRCKWTHFEPLMFLREVIEPRPGGIYHLPSYPVSKKLCLKSDYSVAEEDLEDEADEEMDEEEDEREKEQDKQQQMENTPSNTRNKRTRKPHNNNRKIEQRHSSTNQFHRYDNVDNNHEEDNISLTLSNSDYQNLEDITDSYPADTKNELCESLSANIITSPTTVPLTTTRPTITTNTLFTSNPSPDQWSIFGDLIANEFRHFNSDISRKKLKRKIMQAILEVGEEDDKYSKH